MLLLLSSLVEASAAGSDPSCADLARDPSRYVLTFDASTGQFTLPEHTLFSNMQISVCVSDHAAGQVHQAHVGSQARDTTAPVAPVEIVTGRIVTLGEHELSRLYDPVVACQEPIRDAAREESTAAQGSVDLLLRAVDQTSSATPEQVETAVKKAGEKVAAAFDTAVACQAANLELAEVWRPALQEAQEAQARIVELLLRNQLANDRLAEAMRPVLHQKSRIGLREYAMVLAAQLERRFATMNLTAGSATADAGKTPGVEAVLAARDATRERFEQVAANYDRLVALVATKVESDAEGVEVVPVGVYPKNTLVDMTFETQKMGFSLGADGTTLEQRTVRTEVDAPQLQVHDRAWFTVEPGFGYGWLPDRSYRMVSGAEGAPNQVVEDSVANFKLATFLYFHACAQDFQQTLHARTCAPTRKGAAHDFRRYLPSVALGVPIGQSTFQGNGLVGFGLPYIPFLSVFAGVQVGRVASVPDSILNQGTSATAVDDIVTHRFAAAPALYVTASPEIIGMLVPDLQPAKN